MEGVGVRQIFGTWIVERAAQDPIIILLTSDGPGFGVFDEFQKQFPDRFFNVGLCEQSMISMSSGLALGGLRPYVFACTPFLIERTFEQIKLNINLQNVKVTLVGFADYPYEGPTHAELDGPYMMRMFRNITSFFPKNSKGAQGALDWSYKISGPAFISLKRDPNG